MKLLLVSVKSEISKGGIAVWTNMFLSRCVEYDIHCDLVNTEVVGKRLQKGVFMINIADEFIRTRRIFKDLKQSLRTEKYDVVHLNTSCGKFGLFRDYLVARKVYRKKIPLILHFHCDIPYWINSKFRKKCLKKLVTLSSCNLVLCKNSQKYLEKELCEKSIIMPNFVDESAIRKDEKTINETPENAFFVGRVERAKGAAEIFELAKRFTNIKFKLSGNISDEVKAWEKPKNIELTGPVSHDKVIDYLDETDLFIFPSHSEGFSLALAEAMARGVPCIATDVGANADMLSNECGVIVEKGNVDAMEKAIGNLFAPRVRENLSQNAVNKVRREYTVDTVLKKFCEIYRGVQ